MTRIGAIEVLATIKKLGLVLVFYHQALETAKRVARAYYDGGGRVLEFTNRGAGACQVFAELYQWCVANSPGLILGVGSVEDSETAMQYVNAGAQFVVGPVLDEQTARRCHQRGVPYCPGCGSATELKEAQALGCLLVKDFPGDCVGGPAFAKAILGPRPWTDMMITGGVKATWESIKEWFELGKVAAVGIGSDIVNEKVLAGSNFEDAIAAKTAEVLGWIREARGISVFQGVDHVGLFPFGGVPGEKIAGWYARVFRFGIQEGKSSYFLSGSGPGRLEVMKVGPGPTHIAILVADFEQAVATLQAAGVELDEPILKPDVKAVYLKESDPAGNRVHLLWRR